jgi:uncharacterized membrane protein YeaQ/YmgE (transglycosylase-associated protein family)
MLNFLWWFVVGPLVGFLAGKLMKTSHSGWLNAVAGLFGAILGGTLCEFAGFAATYTWVEACLSGGAGALLVAIIFGKLLGNKTASAPRQSSSRSTYTSYKSRMGK